MIRVSCYSCGSTYNVRDDKAGRKLKCRECQSIVEIPFEDEYELEPAFDEFEEEFAPPARRRHSQGSRRRKSSSKSGSQAGIIVAAVSGGVLLLAGLVVGIVFAVNAASDDDDGSTKPGRDVAGNSGGLGFGNKSSPRKSAGYAQHDRFYGDLTRAIQDMLTIMKSVRDPLTARLAAARIDGVTARLEELANRVRSFPPISSREKAEIKRKHARPGMSYASGYSAGRRAGLAARGERTFIAAVQRYSRAITRLQPYLR